MISGREAETQSSTEKEEAEDDVLIFTHISIIIAEILEVENRQGNHPDSGQEMGVDIRGLVVDVKTAEEGVCV